MIDAPTAINGDPNKSGTNNNTEELVLVEWYSPRPRASNASPYANSVVMTSRAPNIIACHKISSADSVVKGASSQQDMLCGSTLWNQKTSCRFVRFTYYLGSRNNRKFSSFKAFQFNWEEDDNRVTNSNWKLPEG
ncbi:hypothetical protein Y032_0020g167 [Ancylostoma ceylanicum]|uniref:Uncharacterized protein n=1 Tax=Ancylostoma ceylanicum TaxID=53326 RepID=A0A016V0L8_9BILA|nr:hypothetical protein Y032_0020g167 [Ancylostoma ceylanicum]